MSHSGLRLAEEIGNLLRSSGMTVSLAESCTGGMLGAILTSAPGASDWFAGGVTAYSDLVKVSLLNVPEETIAEHGAVSRQTAEAMASGIRELTGTDLSLAVTGIAGPGGGSAEKPVGTVWMALCHADRVLAWRESFSGGREVVRRDAADYLLRKLLLYLREVGD
ncbi:MAG: CinA family protein [Candidatus Fermentibacteraceae bacterium]|nr:CinA family protein [Candidatus Fermentibacteraceae bacterium]